MRTALVAIVGFVLVGGCTHADGPVVQTRCGEGTELVGPLCVLTAETRVCGDNTVEIDGGCAPLPPTICAPGSTLVEGACLKVDDGTFEFRGLAPSVWADQHSVLSLRLFEWGADGAPVSDQLVLSVVPAGRGTLSTAQVMLDGGLGGATLFTPCDPASEGCGGPFEITAARVSAPDVVVGSTGTRLMSIPDEPAPSDLCQIDGNIFHFEMLDQSGAVTSQQTATRQLRGDTFSAGTEVDVWVTADDRPNSGPAFTVMLSTWKIATPLARGWWPEADSCWDPELSPDFNVAIDSTVYGVRDAVFHLQRLDIGPRGTLDEILLSYRLTIPVLGGSVFTRGCLHYASR